MAEYLDDDITCKDCYHKNACARWLKHGKINYDDFSYSTEFCPDYKSAADVVENEKYNRLLKVAKKMHTWIFMNTGDEQAAYDECGLTDEENVLLGYGGKIELYVREEEE